MAGLWLLDFTSRIRDCKKKKSVWSSKCRQISAFTHKMETRQLANRQIWVKFLIAYFIFACVILAHAYPESFPQESVITFSR